MKYNDLHLSVYGEHPSWVALTTPNNCTTDFAASPAGHRHAAAALTRQPRLLATGHQCWAVCSRPHSDPRMLVVLRLAVALPQVACRSRCRRHLLEAPAEPDLRCLNACAAAGDAPPAWQDGRPCSAALIQEQQAAAERKRWDWA